MNFKKLVLNALATGDAHQAALTALKSAADTMTYAAYRDQTARIIGEKLGVEPHKSRKGGGLTFTKDSAAEQRHTRLLKLHKGYGKGKSSGQTAPVAVPKALVSGTVRAICEAGLTKQQFDAFVAELRAAVQFK